MKVARPVWRGPVEKGAATPPRRLATLLTKTLANKHKTTVADIYTRYKTHLSMDGKTYKVLQATVPREGKKPLVATWGAVPLKWEVKTPVEDQPQRQLWNDRSELER